MSTSPFRLDGRTALVTGAGQGIGRAVAVFLAAQGARIAVNDLDRAAAEATAASLPGSSIVVDGDVTDPESVRRVLALLDEAGAAPSILVNNAAAPTPVRPFLELEPGDIESALTSLQATLTVTRAALPGMIARGHGRIVNVTSIAGVHGVVDMSAYSAAKGAIHALTAALAKEVARAGVTVNCVAPGTVDTPRQRERPAALRAQREAAIPVGRFAAPAEVAAAVGFFASDEASYITGEVLLVDGGRP